MKSITVSAPGKLMLLGEHAVVYNHPCIVTAVGQRLSAKITLTDENTFVLDAPDVKLEHYSKSIGNIGQGDIPKSAQFVELAVKHFYDLYNVTAGLHIETSTEFSSLFGFGSSSASTVCVLKALSELFGLHLDNKQLFDISYKTVLAVQGKGSGFDIAAAIYGGTLYFVTGGKVIEPIQSNISLIIGYTGIKADTVTLVNQVKEKNEPKRLEEIYTQIEQLVNKAKQAIADGDLIGVGKLMNDDQRLLAELGVSIPKLDAMINGALSAGAYGAKLSGAGGGDCMIAIGSAQKHDGIVTNIEKAGGKIIDIESNVEGVRIEKVGDE